MPFSMAIEACAASGPSSEVWLLPKPDAALRRAWVTIRAPTTDRSVPVIGAASASFVVSSLSHGGAASRSTRHGVPSGISARTSAAWSALGTSVVVSSPLSSRRIRRPGSSSPTARSSRMASSAPSRFRAESSTEDVISDRSLDRTTEDTNS